METVELMPEVYFQRCRKCDKIHRTENKILVVCQNGDCGGYMTAPLDLEPSESA